MQDKVYRQDTASEVLEMPQDYAGKQSGGGKQRDHLEGGYMVTVGGDADEG